MSTSNHTPRSGPLWTKKNAADFFSVSERTLDRWLNQGALPSNAKLVIGGAVRFRPDILVAYVGETEANEGVAE